MKKVFYALVILMSFLLVSEVAAVALAEGDEEGETSHDEEMSLCLSAIFLLVLLLIAVALVVLGFSRKGRK